MQQLDNMEDIKKKSNTELSKIRKEVSTEFERVRLELIKMYDYWVSLEKTYNEVNAELNDRFGVNNK